MKAIAKVRPEPGVEIIDVPEPEVRPGHVKVKIEAGSVCGTDLHIYSWDPWAASRIKPPRIVGHEFCGTIVEVGEGVPPERIGEFVSSESHIVCGHCRQCREGQGHVCANTLILGVDVDGGFGEFAVIPAENARTTDRSVPKEIAAFQDALGNAVHTVMAGPVRDQKILITGMGPIGLFAVAICKALGAKKVIATEVSPYRIDLAHRIGADEVVTPADGDPCNRVERLAPGGVDATLEMSGHPSQLDLAIRCTRPGGRVSLLGVYGKDCQEVDMNALIFKGLEVQGIVGRRLWQTWDQMAELLKNGLDVSPVVTHVVPYTEITEAMEMMKAGKAGKIVFTF